jgi:hypothetical protein
LRPIPSPIDPTRYGGPGRKNEKLRAKEIATAQRFMAKEQELNDYHAKREARRAARRFDRDGMVPIEGPVEGFQVPGGVPSGGQQGSGGIPIGVGDLWGDKIFVGERRGPRSGRGGLMGPGIPIVGEVPNGGQQVGGGGRNVDAGRAEPGHKMFPTVREPEKKGIFPTQADGKPAKPTPYNYAELPGRRGGGGFGGMGGGAHGMGGMGRGGR